MDIIIGGILGIVIFLIGYAIGYAIGFKGGLEGFDKMSELAERSLNKWRETIDLLTLSNKQVKAQEEQIIELKSMAKCKKKGKKK